MDEFGRVRPPPDYSPPRRAEPPPRRESSASRERRKRERKEKKREKREERRAGGGDASTAEPDYRASLYPPGADLSLYNYDHELCWHVTSDRVWWYRPDLCLWYDCRHENYYTYDPNVSEYVSVEKGVATSALAEGRSVAPPPHAAAAATGDDAEGSAAGEGGGALAEAGGGAPPDGADAQADGALIGPEVPPPNAAAESEEEGEEEGLVPEPVAAEERIAAQLRAHTESWQGKKETQEDRYIQAARLAKLGTVFGVFDGHGGVHAAEYVAKHLPNNVQRCLQKQGSSAASRSRLADGGAPEGNRRVSRSTRAHESSNAAGACRPRAPPF